MNSDHGANSARLGVVEIIIFRTMCRFQTRIQAMRPRNIRPLSHVRGWCLQAGVDTSRTPTSIGNRRWKFRSNTDEQNSFFGGPSTQVPRSKSLLSLLRQILTHKSGVTSSHFRLSGEFFFYCDYRNHFRAFYPERKGSSSLPSPPVSEQLEFLQKFWR
ncbi:hypothetical protein BDN72DRAFT_84767 [Pluteus cervinus]|uniref:Uncharacterized protein n=1 Tax=Pluteus cervinus TaxID=181527 RepID=A0ACD3APG1_9AGAR|nr:hypothetical protein BDN72DRAFT_84767 [Pluteus cervinus]